MDKFTFSDERIINRSKNFITIKADLTKYQSETINNLRKEFKIKGVPTIVFLNSQGNELKELRLIEFEEADRFISRMNKALE